MTSLSVAVAQFPLWVISVSLCQSTKIKLINMCISIARTQFKINTHWCWNEHLCIPDGLSVVQYSLGHAIWIVFFDTISVAWNKRAGQVAGGVASVWRYCVRSLLGPWWFISSFVGYKHFPVPEHQNQTNKYIYIYQFIFDLLLK